MRLMTLSNSSHLTCLDSRARRSRVYLILIWMQLCGVQSVRDSVFCSRTQSCPGNPALPVIISTASASAFLLPTMFSLPEVQGKYPVGATTFAIPINAQDDASRVVGRAKLKASSGGQPDTPALKLEEVAFTAYYPADTQVVAHKGVHWFPRCVTGQTGRDCEIDTDAARPVHKALNGYLHLYGLNSWLVSGLLGPLGGVAHMLKVSCRFLLDHLGRMTSSASRYRST